MFFSCQYLIHNIQSHSCCLTEKQQGGGGLAFPNVLSRALPFLGAFVENKKMFLQGGKEQSCCHHKLKIDNAPESVLQKSSGCTDGTLAQIFVLCRQEGEMGGGSEEQASGNHGWIPSLSAADL